MVLKSILLVLITLAIAMHITSAFVTIVRNTDTATNKKKDYNHNNGRIRIEERRRRITTPLPSSTTTTMTTTQLFLAAARRSTGNKKTNNNKKKKKRKSPVTAFDTSSTSRRRKDTNKKSRNNNTAASSGESKATTPMITTTATKNQKKKQYAAPPWQTISTKDMNKNAEAEKERRRIAQDTGQHMTPYEVDDTKRSYTRSLSFLSSADQLLLSWKNSFRSSSPGSSSSSSGSGGGSGKIDPNKHEIIFQGAYLQKQLPPRMGVPEIAFLGRSNVGKSSLLNRLVSNACDVARVGKTPGATASVNLYAIFDKAKNKKSQQQQLPPKPRRRRPRQQQTTTASSGTTTTNNNNKKNNNNSKPLLGLVDLPGFGYAKLDKGTKQSVQDTAEQYLAKRKELALGILLVDSRRTPTMDDKAVLAALYDMGLPLMVVATKVDKYSTQPQIDTALLTINQELGLPPGQPLCVSCVTGQGIKDLWNIIMEACESHVEELRTDIEHGGSSSSTNNQQQQQKSMEYYSDDNNDGDDYDDEIAYSQGYDWIQGSVMYEEDYDEQYFDDNDDRKNNSKDNDYYKIEDDNDDMSDTSTNTANDNAPKKESLKDLRKKAKEMEKRGEFY